MEIKTKFGPAALIMDNTGAKMGIVKKVNITIKEGDTMPTITYDVHGNGNAQMINENDAIGLMPRVVAPASVVVAPEPAAPAAPAAESVPF